MGYEPNGWADENVHSFGGRYGVYCTCRQCGKTETLSMEIHDAMTSKPDPFHGPPKVGVLSFDYEHALYSVNRYIDRIHMAFGEDYYHLNKNDRELHIPETGAMLKWMSADNPRSVLGGTWSHAFIDEAQSVSDEVWFNFRPTLSVRNSDIRVFGTPDPVLTNSWFEGMFLRGMDESEENYHSFTLPCYLNKWMSLEDIDEAQKSMTDREFRAKYMGEWVDNDGRVFKGVDEVFTGNIVDYRTKEGKEWISKHGPYYMGLDVAKSDDYTVAYVIDATTRGIVARYRVNRLQYTEVGKAVEALYNSYKCTAIMLDTTGVGEAVADMLREKKLPVIPFVFTQKSKQELIATLQREIEHKRVAFPVEDQQLFRELKAFAATVSTSNNVQYSAPAGYHDDCVIAAALAVYCIRGRGNVTVGSYL